MTNREIDRKVAAWVGLEEADIGGFLDLQLGQFFEEPDGTIWAKIDTPEYGPEILVWSPTTDANLCREVEAEIEKRGPWREFIHELDILLHGPGIRGVGYTDFAWSVRRATPRQRMEALVGVIEGVPK